MPRELIRLAAPVTLSSEEVHADGLVFIKGFASVEVTDRSGDIVPPEEFDIKQFMAAPAILVNHDYWIDRRGNRVAVGKPEKLFVARLVKLEDDDDNWGIKDVSTGKVENKFPKSKIPNLGSGDRGLFIVAAITDPDVSEMIKRGELNAFSWRGLVNVSYRVNKKTNLVERILKDIDLYDISLVNLPNNPNSTFVVGKSADDGIETLELGGPLYVYLMKLEKSRFVSKKDALEYLNTHSLKTDCVRESDEAYFCLQKKQEDFDVGKLINVKLSEGVNVIVGPLLKKNIDSRSILGWLCSKEETRKFEDVFKGGFMEETQKDSSAAMRVEGTDAALDAPGCTEQVEVSKDVSDLEKFQKGLAISVSESVANGLKPFLSEIAESQKKIGEILSKMVNADESKEEPKIDTQKSIEEVWSRLNGLAGAFKESQQQLGDIARYVGGLAKAVPFTSTRNEKVDISKDSKNDDPNKCLDSVFPFLYSA